MEYSKCDVEKHNLVDVAELVYQTEPDLTKMFFSKKKIKAIQRIIKLIEKECNSFSYKNIFLAHENTNVFGILIGNTGDEIDKEDEKKEIFSTLDITGALRLSFYDKLLVSRLLTTEILPNEYYIGVLCVNKDYQRKGIGEKLIKNAAKIAHKKNCSRVILDVTKENKKAINFYKKCGFRIYDEVNSSFFFHKISVYKMELPIK